MKNSSEDLWELVDSLEINEKRYVVLYLKGFSAKGERYLKLFQVLGKMEVYDDRMLAKKMKKVFGDKSSLANGRHYLYEQVSRALFLYQSANDSHLQVRELIGRAEILLRKGLTKQAQKFLSKAEALAKRDEMLEALAEIHHINSLIMMNSLKLSLIETEGKVQVGKEAKVLDQIQERLDFKEELIELLPRLKKAGSVELNGVPEPAQWQTRLDGLSAEQSRIYGLMLGGMIYNQLGMAEAISFRLQLHELFREKPSLAGHRLPILSSNLYNLCVHSFQKGDFAMVRQRLEEMPALLDDMGSVPDPMSLRLLQKRMTNLRLVLAVLDRDDPGPEMGPEPDWKKFAGIAGEFELNNLSLEAVLELIRGNTSIALSRINNCLNHCPQGLRQDSQFSLRLIRAFILLSSEQLDFLESELPNLQRRLRQLPPNTVFFQDYLVLLKAILDLGLPGVRQQGWSFPDPYAEQLRNATDSISVGVMNRVAEVVFRSTSFSQ